MLMQTKSYFKKSLANNISHGLELGEFSVYYQPKVGLGDRKIKSLEALCRWYSPGVGWVSPAEFIPVAESSDTILKIGRWILFAACEQTREWQNNGFPDLSVSVNLSPLQLASENIISVVESVLSKTGLGPDYLELEITESIFIEDSVKSIENLRQLKRLGIGLAIDDFGTSYSPIGYLKTFPFDTLKIDQVFARSLHLFQNQMVIQAITSLSRQLGLITVLGGIESEAGLVMANYLGCDQAQGFAVLPPVSVKKITSVLEDNLKNAV
jgi:diguanylate cyclase